MSGTSGSRPEPSAGGKRFDDSAADAATGEAAPGLVAGGVVLVALVAGPLLTLFTAPLTLVSAVATTGPTGGVVAGALVAALPDTEVNRTTATEAAVGAGGVALLVGGGGLVLTGLSGWFASNDQLVSAGMRSVGGTVGAAVAAGGVVEVVRVARERTPAE